ncbi:DUF4442 domain-containing protein [Actinosynnema sp. NPDC020468]|uniref:DUF4442 domain-containing protein n=1 Tax=Actinosynnema sp. NPDC020468 TaxID=3154488 RepID=UPI0033D978AD
MSDFASLYGPVDPAAPDFEHLRRVSAGMVPFGNHTGVEITEISAERAVVEIPEESHLRNHLGTVHAGALFTAADIAGAAAFVGAAAHGLARVKMLVLRDSRVSFRKPAVGRVRAIGTVDPRDVAKALAGSGRFDVDGRATIHDESGLLLAKLSFDYVCEVAA